MFYQPGKTDHNLPHDPFKACVIPRPIGWISTASPTVAGGGNNKPSYNLAPYSQFNNLTFDPPYVMFSANQEIDFAPPPPDPQQQSQSQISPGYHRKDTVHNAESIGVFCWQLATYALREAVNASAERLEPGVDEFERAGLEKCWSQTLSVRVPMVEASPVRFECEYYTTLRLPGNPPLGTVDVIIGKVVGIHIDESVLTDGKIDPSKTMPIARCGYYDYAVVRETFQMIIPGDKNSLAGMEGSVKANKERRRLIQGEETHPAV